MELDYDYFESSMAETVHYIIVSEPSENNRHIIENAYKFMTEDFLKARAKGVQEEVQRNLYSLNRFISS